MKVGFGAEKRNEPEEKWGERHNWGKLPEDRGDLKPKVVRKMK